MWCIGKLSHDIRGAGSIVGAVFILLMLLSGFTFYMLNVDINENYRAVLQTMDQLDLRRKQENIEFKSVSTTNDNKLNMTVKNTGSYQAHLIWLGIFDETSTPTIQEYCELDVYVDPAEAVTNIPQENITILEGQERVIQLVTELGNTFSYSYPTSEEESTYRYDFVDKTCDLYPPSAKGNHSFFSAQQAGPDGIRDTLTEEDTGSTGDQTRSPSSYTNKDAEWIEDEGSNSAYSSDNGYAGQTSTDNTGCDYLSFGFNIPSEAIVDGIEVSLEGHRSGAPQARFSAQLIKNGIEVGDEKVVANNYGTSDSTQTVGGPSDLWGTSWTRDDIIASNFGVRVETYIFGPRPSTIYLDHVVVKVYIKSFNYELDLEVQWTSVDFDEANEWLCIYGGTMGDEDVLVDVWNGTDWITVLEDLESGWNSVDVSSYLVSSPFTIRFRDGIKTGDTTKDSWEIDATFLHVWTEEG